MIRQWPELIGLMSMKAIVMSSSKIFMDGICPSRSLQKTQSVIYGPPIGRSREPPWRLHPPSSSHRSDGHRQTRSRSAPPSSPGTSDRQRPAVRIRRLAVLDRDDRVVQALGERPDPAAVDHHLLALVGQ